MQSSLTAFFFYGLIFIVNNNLNLKYFKKLWQKNNL